MEAGENIVIRGAKVNNLKNISITIPRNKFTVITGVSGSGKSSLAFDTLSPRDRGVSPRVSHPMPGSSWEGCPNLMWRL